MCITRWKLNVMTDQTRIQNCTSWISGQGPYWLSYLVLGFEPVWLSYSSPLNDLCLRRSHQLSSFPGRSKWICQFQGLALHQMKQDGRYSERPERFDPRPSETVVRWSTNWALWHRSQTPVWSHYYFSHPSCYIVSQKYKNVPWYIYLRGMIIVYISIITFSLMFPKLQ